MTCFTWPAPSFIMRTMGSSLLFYILFLRRKLKKKEYLEKAKWLSSRVKWFGSDTSTCGEIICATVFRLKTIELETRQYIDALMHVNAVKWMPWRTFMRTRKTSGSLRREFDDIQMTRRCVATFLLFGRRCLNKYIGCSFFVNQKLHNQAGPPAI